MKKIIIGILCFCMLITLPPTNKSYASSTNMQAAWITTIHNQDWPKVKDNAGKQKQEMITMLDTLKSTGIDTVMFQVRPKSDALYKSSINPWSDILTGKQGKDPGYDPLQFVIDEADKRGMKVHAWINPYRVTTVGTDLNSLSENHPARKNPNWVLQHTVSVSGKDELALAYNPGLPEVRKHLVDTISEIVRNYNIDGIHFDDYFYRAGMNDDEAYKQYGNGMKKDDWRRENVNILLRETKQAIKSINPEVEFGVSPSGIWRNKSNDKLGSNTKGKESYSSDYADSRKWVKENMVDYLVPQVYWQRNHSAADYETIVSWWADVAKGTNVDLYIGQGIYKDEVATEIDKQLEINEKYGLIKGSVHFSSRDILNNRKGAKDKIKAYNEKSKSKLADIKNHWAEKNIIDFVNKGYIDGYPNNTFKPDGSITRAEFVKLTNKVFGYTEKGTENFKDVSPSHWFYNDIIVAMKAGYIDGKSATVFDPDAPITRQEVAKIATTIKNNKDTNLDKIAKFADGNQVEDWAKPYVEGAIEAGYIEGLPGNKISPKGKTTRAEAVVILSRMK